MFHAESDRIDKNMLYAVELSEDVRSFHEALLEDWRKFFHETLLEDWRKFFHAVSIEKITGAFEVNTFKGEESPKDQ